MGILIQVELVAGHGAEFDPPPGRQFLAARHHTFRQLAMAIDLAFGRWDLSHLHRFKLTDPERLLGFAFENEYDDVGPDIEDDSKLRPGRVLKKGQRFEYTFDLGDDWRHRCEVLATSQPEVEPDRDGTLPLPDLPLVTMAWGSLPDQYGRPGLGIDPYDGADDLYPEGLRDVATLWAEAMTARRHPAWDNGEAKAILLAWLRLGRPPRRSEVDPPHDPHPASPRGRPH